ncbi:MAG: sulfite exporter TauE/SafE family protein [Candidatus Peregrinibacteria bacterium]|nr:sulfite exporter TauE/SafE family protein [Candidatus Peregrinibacteria bacterium]
MIEIIILGFVLGIQHAFDSDHVVAVSTMVNETKSLKKSSKIGAIWGIGHTFTLFIGGLLLMTFKTSIPEQLALSFEFLIGIVLVLLGLNVYLKIRKEKIHLHRHAHEGTEHAHLHSHEKSLSHKHAHIKKPLLIGMLHGLAGSAGLMLLVLGTVQSIAQGLFYILIFGLGSIIGMSLISTLIGIPFLLTSKISHLQNTVHFTTGTLSILIGIKMMLEIRF